MSIIHEVEKAKEAAAKAALALVKERMRVGLGTGTTAWYFTKLLGEKCRQGFSIEAFATSERTLQQAKECGIPLGDLSTTSFLDIAVDGADEIDPRQHLLKGGGGALTREKIIAAMSKTYVVIADEHKLVNALGKFPLATEILSFGHLGTAERLRQKGYLGTWRVAEDGRRYITDNGNYILDLKLPFPCNDPASHEAAIKQTTGVIETGLFIGMADHVLIGFLDGRVEAMVLD